MADLAPAWSVVDTHSSCTKGNKFLHVRGK